MPDTSAMPDAPNAFDPAASPDAASGAHDALVSGLGRSHDGLASMYSRLGEALSRIDAVHRELEVLAKLGPAVTFEDVVKGARVLVGEGLSPRDLASVLASLPGEGSGAAALQAWVDSHVQSTGETEAKLLSQRDIVRHEMGVAALRVLAGHHFADKMKGAASPLA